jgi:hypothetical protein
MEARKCPFLTRALGRREWLAANCLFVQEKERPVVPTRQEAGYVLGENQEMYTQHNNSCAFAMLLSLDFQFVNSAL